MQIFNEFITFFTVTIFCLNLRPSVGSGKDTLDEWKGLDMLAVTFVRLGHPVAVQETAAEVAVEVVHVVEVVGLEPEAELAVDESENNGKVL